MHWTNDNWYVNWVLWSGWAKRVKQARKKCSQIKEGTGHLSLSNIGTSNKNYLSSWLSSPNVNVVFFCSFSVCDFIFCHWLRAVEQTGGQIYSSEIFILIAPQSINVSRQCHQTAGSAGKIIRTLKCEDSTVWSYPHSSVWPSGLDVWLCPWLVLLGWWPWQHSQKWWTAQQDHLYWLVTQEVVSVCVHTSVSVQRRECPWARLLAPLELLSDQRVRLELYTQVWMCVTAGLIRTFL